MAASDEADWRLSESPLGAKPVEQDALKWTPLVNPGIPLPLSLPAACEEALRLQHLLQAEFEAIRVQDLGSFETLQPAKERALLLLGNFMKAFAETASPDGQLLLADEQLTQWETFQTRMSACRDSHQRNAILIRSKLESISATLKVLQNSDNASSIEVYDRLGRMSGYRRGHGRGYEDA